MLAFLTPRERGNKMTKTLKTGVLVSLFAVLTVGLTVAFSSGEKFARAEGCHHVGNHYEGIAATSKKSGIREYWVCCECHEHYFAQPAGTWTDAGVATITVDQNDDRYIPVIGKTDTNGFVYDATGTEIIEYKGSDTNVVIPEGVTKIADNAFNGNTTIKSMVVPEGVTDIGTGAFKNSKIETISLPETLTRIEDSAFEGAAIKTLDIPDTVTEIGKSAFKNSKIETVNLPESLTTIEESAFEGSNLKSVTIPESVTKIESYAFKDCEGLHSVVIPATVKEIDAKVFYDKDVASYGKSSNDIVIYVTFTEQEEQTYIKQGKLASNWKTAYTTSPLGWGWLGTDVDATVYYKGQWHYDANGNPVKGK